jgi:hypothetical protein
LEELSKSLEAKFLSLTLDEDSSESDAEILRECDIISGVDGSVLHSDILSPEPESESMEISDVLHEEDSSDDVEAYKLRLLEERYKELVKPFRGSMVALEGDDSSACVGVREDVIVEDVDSGIDGVMPGYELEEWDEEVEFLRPIQDEDSSESESDSPSSSGVDTEAGELSFAGAMHVMEDAEPMSFTSAYS